MKAGQISSIAPYCETAPRSWGSVTSTGLISASGAKPPRISSAISGYGSPILDDRGPSNTPTFLAIDAVLIHDLRHSFVATLFTARSKTSGMAARAIWPIIRVARTMSHLPRRDNRLVGALREGCSAACRSGSRTPPRSTPPWRRRYGLKHATTEAYDMFQSHLKMYMVTVHSTTTRWRGSSRTASP